MKPLAILIVLACIGVDSAYARVVGFNESFSGDGPFDGFDNDWIVSSDGQFSGGGYGLSNSGQPEDRLTQFMSGRGSFRTTLEVSNLDLSTRHFDSAGRDQLTLLRVFHDLHTNNNDSDFITFGVAGPSVYGSPDGPPAYRFFVKPTSDSDNAFIPTEDIGESIRFELVYDDSSSMFTLTVDPNMDLEGDNDVVLGPFEYTRAFSSVEHGVEISVTSSTIIHTASAVLQHFEVQPISSIFGDFNGNEILDAADIDLLAAEIREATNDPDFDLNNDGLVDSSDRDIWVHDLRAIFYGDADMNEIYDSTDLVQVFIAGEYEDGIDGNSTWATGDWDGDGDFKSDDIVLSFIDGGYVSATPIPEPNGITLLAISAALIGCTRLRNSSRLRRFEKRPIVERSLKSLERVES